MAHDTVSPTCWLCPVSQVLTLNNHTYSAHSLSVARSTLLQTMFQLLPDPRLSLCVQGHRPDVGGSKRSWRDLGHHLARSPPRQQSDLGIGPEPPPLQSHQRGLQGGGCSHYTWREAHRKLPSLSLEQTRQPHCLRCSLWPDWTPELSSKLIPVDIGAALQQGWLLIQALGLGATGGTVPGPHTAPALPETARSGKETA